MINSIGPDVLLLTDIDYDAGHLALSAFNDALANPYPHLFALPPNSGLATSLDLDGNGRSGEPRDAQGYGRFFGDGGMAILSRLAVHGEHVQDFTALLWADLPDARLPRATDGTLFPSAEAVAHQRLSSTGHWIVPLDLGEGRELSLMAWSATPPVFDGPEDRNGLRNHDELMLWSRVLDGQLGQAPDSFVILGNANLDPADGEGIRPAMADFLADPRIQDPMPTSRGASQVGDAGQTGDPALDTVDWPESGPGNLRVTYVLPSADRDVLAAGVFWPATGGSDAALLGDDGLAAGPHRMVWVDIAR